MIHKTKVENLPGERWAKLNFEGREHLKQYAVSNKGRILSYKHNPDDARLISLKENNKRAPKLRILFGKKPRNFPVHHLVAEMFVPRLNPYQDQVIHLDRNPLNNVAENLKWVTKEELLRRMAGKHDAQVALKLGPGEIYKIIDIKSPNRQYAITNMGRLISFDKEVTQGFIMKLSAHEQGYKIWRYKLGKKNCHQLIHRLVAEYFIDKPSPEHNYVIHLDHKKNNNRAENLRWTTLTEQRKYSSQSEDAKANAMNLRNRSKRTGKGNKLSSSKVLIIKKILQSAQRPKLKILARQFGVSEMQLHRIKTGENWGWLKPDSDQP